MDAVDRFAAEAALFQEWALRGTDRGHAAAREALIRTTRLYVAALTLPPPWSEALEDQPDAVSVGNEEWRAVFDACARLPMDMYGAVFDPLTVPPEDPVIGSLSDDMADIYRDVVTGLQEYRAGRREQAVWEWSWGFQHHWGGDATNAIRALHCWLETHGFDAEN